jgi:hypothetical protein
LLPSKLSDRQVAAYRPEAVLLAEMHFDQSETTSAPARCCVGCPDSPKTALMVRVCLPCTDSGAHHKQEAFSKQAALCCVAWLCARVAFED